MIGKMTYGTLNGSSEFSRELNRVNSALDLVDVSTRQSPGVCTDFYFSLIIHR